MAPDVLAHQEQPSLGVGETCGVDATGRRKDLLVGTERGGHPAYGVLVGNGTHPGGGPRDGQHVLDAVLAAPQTPQADEPVAWPA